eukprot:TRINITY_DN2177_c0_g1_i7.p3 TRINITY_DN2177_c0_g1~~TRINITY_DN2177_c0_g1_i7.p3  ORF type:complete len:189 (-),score=56.89 TRINITY_DN2177_c0_g1_i7:351-917(-)
MARSQASGLICLAALVGLAMRQLGHAFVGAGVPDSHTRGVALRAEEGSSSPTDRVQLKVLSPEGDGIKETCSEVILPSASGQLGVLANHAPMMSALDVGVLRYKQGGKWKPLVVMGGFATIDSNTLSVLVNDWETADDIDANQAKGDMESATQALEKAESKKEKLDATTRLKKASARLQAAMFLSGKK